MPSAAQRTSLAELVSQYHANLTDGGAAARYLSERGLYRSAIDKFQLGYTGDTGDKAAHRLAIPYLTPAGPWQIKYRCIQDHDCKDNGHVKYLNTDGSQQRLFNAQTLLTASRVAIVEGEIDAISIEMCGVPAVAYPGADSWKAHPYWSWCFDSLDEVVVIADGDPPEKNPRNKDKQPGGEGWIDIGVGEDSARRVVTALEQAIPDLDVRLEVMPLGHDTNSFINEFGDFEFLELTGLL